MAKTFMSYDHQAERTVAIRSRWPIVVIRCLALSLLVPGILSASTDAGTETRVWALDFAEQVHVGGSAAPTLELHRGCEPTYDQFASDSFLAARGAARTAPRNLAEKLALDEAKGGAGKRIMQGKINDPKFPEDVWAKMQHVHEHPGGTQTVVHYWENLQTAAREGFKFK